MNLIQLKDSLIRCVPAGNVTKSALIIGLPVAIKLN